MEGEKGRTTKPWKAEDRDYAGLCLSYLCGTVAGAGLTEPVQSGNLSGPEILDILHSSMAVIAAFLIGAVAWTITRQKHRCNVIYPHLLTTFFLLGAGGYLQADVTGYFPGKTLVLPSLCSEKLKMLISGLPFQNEETADLIQALLTGDRSGLEKETQTAFRKSGASHILALSGMHLGLVYLLLNKTLQLIGNTPVAVKTRSLAGILITGFYVLMTGASDSIVRAFLFITINEICRMTGRKTFQVRTLLTSLTLQLTLDPTAILSPGFQLSYCAMCGIYILFPKLEAWYPEAGTKYDPIRKIWSLSALSISCQAFTAPVAGFHFGTFPQYFLITNLIAMPLTTGLMLLSTMTLASSVLGSPPEILVGLTEKTADLLVSGLTVISSL